MYKLLFEQQIEALLEGKAEHGHKSISVFNWNQVKVKLVLIEKPS